ncbi:MAG: hypothetical protein AAF289_05410 [Cyanobacteria bacterium P01_A01_bin.135]
MIPTSSPAPQGQIYREQLHPWCIIRLLPKAQRITVARFRKRNDADAHLRTLRRLIPQATFIIIFAPPPIPDPPSLSNQLSGRKPLDLIQQSACPQTQPPPWES